MLSMTGGSNLRRSGLAPPLGELAQLVRLAPHHTAGYAGRAFLTRPAAVAIPWIFQETSVWRGWADEYPQGAGRICNAPSSRTAALGIGPYRVRV